MAIIITWIALSIVAGVIAENKGRSSVGFFFLSLVLSPLVGVIAALIAKTDEKKLNEDKISTGDSKKCPFCAEIIKAEAMVCRYCGRELAEAKEVDWIVKKYSQKEKKGATKLKGKKGSGYGLFYAILCLLAIGIIFINNYKNDVEPSISKNSTSEVKPSKTSSVSSGQINKGFVEVGYYKSSTVFNSPNRVYSIYVEDFMDSPDVWDRIERYGKSKMWSPKGSTTVLFFNNRQGTPDVTYTGINFPDRYEPYCIAGYWKYTTGKEIFNKYPLKME